MNKNILSYSYLVFVSKYAYEHRLKIEQLRTIQMSFIFDFISNLSLK